ncbi:MAG TPA: MFS transporter [Gammaproteobacteria bacterium]|nr:MFS transporter [Gammaproteobacteria bacterium]
MSVDENRKFDDQGSVGLRELLRNREFRLIWLIGAASNTLRWLEILAVGVVVFDMTGSPFQVAFMIILRFLPMALMGAFTGVVAERVNRRVFLILSLVFMLGTSVMLTLLAFGGYLNLWVIGLSVVLNGLFWTTDNPIRRTLLGEVVRPAQIGIAMSLDTVTNSTTRFLGPLVGGIFLEFAGLEGVFLVGAVLYAGALLLACVTQPVSARQHREHRSMFNFLADGIRVLQTNRVLVGVLAITVIYNLWAFPFVSMIPVIGKDVLGLSPLPVGLLVSAEGAGTLIGALLVLLTRSVAHYRRLYTFGLGISLAMALIYSQMGSFLPSGTFLALEGIGAGFFAAMQAALVLLNTPPKMRSRMMGLLSVCVGLCALGFLHIGLLADWVGAQNAVLICTAEGLVALFLVCWTWPEIIARQTLPTTDP